MAPLNPNNLNGQLGGAYGSTPAPVTNALSPGQFGGATSYTPPPPPAPTYNQPTATPTTISALSTPAAIKAFQTSQGLTPDGILGPQTMAAYVKSQPGYNATPSGSQFGSSSGSAMGTTTSTAMSTAANSLTALYDTKTGFLTPAGVAAGAPAVNPGDPSAQASTPVTSVNSGQSLLSTTGGSNGTTIQHFTNGGQDTYQNGQLISSTAGNPVNIVSSTIDSNTGNTVNTLSNGQTTITPPSPAVAGLYTSASNATTQETNNFNDQLSALNLTTQQQLQQNATNKANAMAAAEANYDSINSGSDWIGSDKAEYLNSVGAPFDQNATNIQADANIQIKSLNDTHSANLKNINEQLQTGIQTNNSNIYTQASSTLSDIEKGAPVSDYDKQDLINQFVNSGMSLQDATLKVEEATLLGQNVNNKTLTTEARQEQAQYIGLWKNDLATMTDPTISSQD